MYLRDDAIRAFVDNAASEPSLSCIRSVTVKSMVPQCIMTRLKTLLGLIEKTQLMSGLISFSCACSFIGYRSESSDQRRKLLALTLQSLPSTVQHLELSGYYMEHLFPLRPDDRSCLLIARILPQLRSLRLDDMRVCPNCSMLSKGMSTARRDNYQQQDIDD